MTKDEHIEHHKRLHKAFDELLADFMSKTGKLSTRTLIVDLSTWSAEQTENPTEEDLPISEWLKDPPATPDEQIARLKRAVLLAAEHLERERLFDSSLEILNIAGLHKRAGK